MTPLQRYRERRHMTQIELAEKSGVTQQAISKIETRQRENPGVLTMQKLANALRCTVDDLIEEDAADRRKGPGAQDPETGEPA